MRKFLIPFCLLSISFLAIPAIASINQHYDISPEKITIQLKWKHQFQFAGYYAAKEKGFYEDEGLDVTLRERKASENYVEDVIKGKAEYGTADAGLLLYRAQGKPVVLLKQIFQHSPLIFIAKKESGIISPYEMIGKKVRFDPGSGNFAPLTATLIETIGDPSKVVAMPQSYDLRSFVKGDVDVISAYLTDQPFRLKKMGVAFTIINPVNYGVDFYGDNLFTTDAEIKTHPKRVEKVIRATIKGWKYALKHKNEIIDIILAKYSPTADREMLANEAKMTGLMIIPELVKLGSVKPNRYERIAQLYAKIGLLDHPDIPRGFFYQNQEIPLTVAEQTWLLEHPVIRAGVIIQGEPLLFAGKDGRYHGVSIDYLRMLENMLGVRFELVQGTRAGLIGKVRSKEIDMLVNADRAGLDNDKSLLITEPYMDIADGVFAHKTVNYIANLDFLVGKKVAVLRDSPIKKLLESRYPRIIAEPVSDTRNALSRINNGMVFAFIGNVLTTHHIMQHKGYAEIHMVGETPFSSSMVMAFSGDASVLRGILQKAIDGIPPKEKADIYNKWVPLTYREPTNYSWLWKVGAVFIIIAVVILTWNRRLASEVRKRTASLQDSEELFRRLFEDHSAVKLIIHPDTGQILDANKAAAVYYGWTREQLKQMLIQDIITLSPEELKRIMEAISANEQQYFEFRHRLSDGSIRDVAVVSSKLNYMGQDLLHSIVHDITAQKSAEADRERLEQQFRQAQKMEAVGQLAGGVAHDYNNMLTLILGYTKFALENTDPSSPLHADLTEVLNAAKRSADITRQLLAFARKQTVEPEVLNLNDTVEGMLKMLRRLISEHIDLAWIPKEGLWTINMDPSQIDQMLVNLCINARDAIADAGKITIETENVSIDEAYCAIHHDFNPGDFILLAVSDNGSGMDQATVDKVFDPFFTTKGLGRGTGLGLATVYGIVKQNQGCIDVYSVPGEGTTFKIYLPRYAGVEEDIPTKSVDVDPVANGETVLLVEDDVSILQLGKRFLVNMGYRVITAGTPKEAIILAQSQDRDIHLLITDVVMPEMNGRELAERLRAIHPEMKTLFMSGYTANVIAHQGVLEKGVHFIQKPFSRHGLSVKVREALERAGLKRHQKPEIGDRSPRLDT